MEVLSYFFQTGRSVCRTLSYSEAAGVCPFRGFSADAQAKIGKTGWTGKGTTAEVWTSLETKRPGQAAVQREKKPTAEQNMGTAGSNSAPRNHVGAKSALQPRLFMPEAKKTSSACPLAPPFQLRPAPPDSQLADRRCAAVLSYRKEIRKTVILREIQIHY